MVAIRDTHQATFNAILMYDQSMRKKLDGDLALFYTQDAAQQSPRRPVGGLPVVLTLLLMVRSINKPLKKLAQKSVRVGEGDYISVKENSSQIRQSADELGKLYERLTSLVGQLTI